jgi:hypothetical protein
LQYNQMKMVRLKFAVVLKVRFYIAKKHFSDDCRPYTGA